MYRIADDAPIRFENHSDRPNVTGMHFSWLDEPHGATLIKFALRDIAAGEEICVDYNGCSGYDVRDDAAMANFLALCRSYGVVKSPAAFRK